MCGSECPFGIETIDNRLPAGLGDHRAHRDVLRAKKWPR
jgi:hypothetical protein